MEKEDLWEIWEWDGHEEMEALIQEGGEDLKFEDISSIVEKEIRRLHKEIGEDTIPYEQFENKDSSSGLANVIFNLPNKNNAPDTFPLARISNGTLVFGLKAWRKGKNPEY